MAQRQRSLGFTLVEVLIAMILMVLLMLTASLVYQYVNENWSRQQQRVEDSLAWHIDWRIIHQVVSNTYPRIVYQQSPFQYFGAESEPPYGFYFLGRDNGFTGVSYLSVQDPSSGAVYRLFREPDPENSQQWQLVYEEAPLAQEGLYYAGQQLPFNYRRVLVRGQDRIEFRYFGWRDHAQRVRAVPNRAGITLAESPEWYPDFDGMTRDEHPLRLEVRMNDDILRWQLQDSIFANKQRMELR